MVTHAIQVQALSTWKEAFIICSSLLWKEIHANENGQIQLVAYFV